MASDLPWEVMQSQPLSPPPLGVIPNLDNPASRAYQIYIAAGICLPLITVFASLRLYAKVFILKKWTWDDVTFAIGMCTAFSYIGMTTAAACGPVFGKHLWEVTIRDYNSTQGQLSIIFESVYGPFIWFIKLTLFILYLQVFGPLQWLRYLAYSGAIITGLFNFGLMAAYLILCTPRHGRSQLAYLAALNSQRCQESKSVVIILGIISLVSDLYLVILPLPAVWKLQLPLRRKLAVSAMFFTGSIACVASAFALAYRIELNSKSDPTWTFVPLGIVTIIEFTAGIIVCCMPSTTKVFKHFKSPVSSLAKSYLGALRSGSKSSNQKHYELSSVTNLHGAYHNRNQDPGAEGTDMRDGSWPAPQDVESKWEVEHENGPRFSHDGAKIRKTTDIDIARQPRA